MKKLDIIYEDKKILVVNKESGLLTIASGKEKEHTLYREARDYVKKKNPHNKIFIIHRLDKDTSGVVMFAKDEKIKSLYQNNWNSLVKKRYYLAIVEGKMLKERDTIKTYLKESSTLQVFSTTNPNEGKLAITEYCVEKYNKEYTLLNINILTGRKNQIRVHLSELGNSIVGDKKYGSKKNPIRRLCLHSNLLVVKDPTTNKELSFEAKIPHNMKIIIDTI